MVTIPNDIVPNLVKLMTYILKGTFLLNRYAKGQLLNTVPTNASARGARKRYRIVQRLAEGMGRAKRRRYHLSKLERGLGGMSREDMMQEIRLLKANAVVVMPSHRSVALEREFSEEAMTYLKTSCECETDADIATLIQANGALTD